MEERNTVSKSLLIQVLLFVLLALVCFSFGMHKIDDEDGGVVFFKNFQRQRKF